MKNTELDELDIAILNLLQKNGRMPVKDISKQINLSSPAVSTRIERMQRSKYITGYQAIIDPIKVGLYTKAYICLEVKPEQKKKFYPYIEKCNNVIECCCVTGDYSMMLEVIFKTTIELDAFIGELQLFGRTKTLIAFSTSVDHRGILLE